MDEVLEGRRRTSKLFSLGGDNYRLTVGPYSHAVTEKMAVVDTKIETEASRDTATDVRYAYRNDPKKTDVSVFLGETPGDVVVRNKVDGKAITIKPLDAETAPDRAIVNTKITHAGLWGGIDTSLVITDYGFKTAYVIKDSAGQRVIRYAVAGDLRDFRIGQASYILGGKTVLVPTSVSNGVLSMDFRNVPIGTVVDPTVGPVIGATSDGEIRNHPGSGTWAQCVADTAANEYVLTGSDTLSTQIDWNGGAPYLSRLFFPFDTTTLPSDATVTGATAGFDSAQQSIGPGIGVARALLCSGTFDVPLAFGDYSKVGGAISTTEWIPSAPSQAQDFVLNGAGLLAITKGGTTKLSMRHKADIDVAQPANWAAILVLSADYSQAAQRPRLTVDYNAAATNSSASPFRFAQGNSGRPFKWR